MNSDSDVGNDTEITAPPNQHPASEPNATPAESPAQSSRPSAIERQSAAMQSPTTRHIIYKQEAPPDSPTPSFERDSHRGRLGGRALVAVLLIAAGLVATYAFRGHDEERTAPAEPALAQITNALQKTSSADSASALEPAQAMAVSRGKPMNGAIGEPDNGITVPISDISLRVRPELLRQLVAIYRLRLTSDPHNARATATLSRLREHALAELDVISATESPALAANSLELAARLFPELADSPRYRSIAARINPSGKTIAQRQASTPSAAVSAPAQAAPAAAAAALATAIPAVSAQAAASASLPHTPSSAAVASRKPQVRVISLTPGILKNDRFVPRNGGNIFRLNIGYRYRDARLDNLPGSGVIAQLRKRGSSTLLAEVPVEVTGSKGEKSFLIGTFEKGQMGKFYKLSFTVDGHALPSHTVPLMPAEFAGL